MVKMVCFLPKTEKIYRKSAFLFLVDELAAAIRANNFTIIIHFKEHTRMPQLATITRNLRGIYIICICLGRVWFNFHNLCHIHIAKALFAFAPLHILISYYHFAGLSQYRLNHLINYVF